MNRKVYLSFFLLFSVANILQAQRQETKQPSTLTFTLAECKQIALKNNLQIEQTRYQQRSKEVALQTAKQAFLPQVQASVGQNIYTGRSINPFTNQFEIRGIYAASGSLSVSWSVLNGEYYNLMKSRIDYSNAELEIKIKEQEVKQRVTQAFMALLLAKEDVTLAESNFERSKFLYLLETEKRKFAVNNKANFLQSKNAYQNDSINVIIKRNRLLMAKNNLIKEMNVPIDTTFDISFDYQEQINVPDLNVEEIKPYSILLQERRLKITEIDLALSKRRCLPSLGIGAGMNTSYSSAAPKKLFRPDNTFTIREVEVGYLQNNPQEKVVTLQSVPNGTSIDNGFFRQLDYNRGLYAGVSLSIPIFQKGTIRNQINQSRLQMYSQKSLLKGQELEFKIMLMQAKNDVEQAAANYQLSQQQQDIAQETLDIMKEQYTLGKVSFTEYQQAVFALTQAQQATLLAKIDYFLKVESLKILSLKD